jgi:hypothetical protein
VAIWCYLLPGGVFAQLRRSPAAIEQNVKPTENEGRAETDSKMKNANCKMQIEKCKLKNILLPHSFDDRPFQFSFCNFQFAFCNSQPHPCVHIAHEHQQDWNSWT